MSTLWLALFTVASPARAHEVVPAIASMEREGDALSFDIRMNLETVLAGIDQSEVTDTNDAPEAETYDTLRALPPEDLAQRFEAFWPDFARMVDVQAGGERLPLELSDISVEDTPNEELPRVAHVTFTADLPAGAEAVSVGWDRSLGVLVLRQEGVEAPYDGYLDPGDRSPEIALGGGDQAGGWATFFGYIPVGLDHIVPLGLDHILFVLGLFFLSAHWRPLVWQVSAFTAAHTVTLALTALGYISLPGSIVEPLIALSIVYVAFENIFTDGLNPWRPFIVFGFGLLHGMGFASVLAEFGLPQSSFVPALLGFNVGVELGQLLVIAVAFLCVWRAIENSKSGESEPLWTAAYLGAMVLTIALLIPLNAWVPDMMGDLIPILVVIAGLFGLSAVSCIVPRFDGYREIVAMPASVAIGIMATYWVVERVFL